MESRFHGIVLFVRPYKEHDLLVKISTLEKGNVMFFVRGGQSANHALAAQMIPYTFNQYIGTINSSGFSFIKEGQTLYFPKSLQTDLNKQAYATYFSQLIDGVKETEGQVHHGLFDLYLTVIKKLDRGIDPHLLMQALELQILSYYGVILDWSRCKHCGSNQGPFDFSINQAGLLCSNHLFVDPYRLKLMTKTISLAQLLLSTDIGRLQSIKVSSALSNDLDRLIKDVYEEFLGYIPKSKEFINKMQKDDQALRDLLKARSKAD